MFSMALKLKNQLWKQVIAMQFPKEEMVWSLRVCVFVEVFIK
jgi:hypothetical protein